MTNTPSIWPAPTAAVAQAMEQFGWDRWTAERHVQQRRSIADRLSRDRAARAAAAVRAFQRGVA